MLNFIKHKYIICVIIKNNLNQTKKKKRIVHNKLIIVSILNLYNIISSSLKV